MGLNPYKLSSRDRSYFNKRLAEAYAYIESGPATNLNWAIKYVEDVMELLIKLGEKPTGYDIAELMTGKPLGTRK